MTPVDPRWCEAYDYARNHSQVIVLDEYSRITEDTKNLAIILLSFYLAGGPPFVLIFCWNIYPWQETVGNGHPPLCTHICTNRLCNWVCVSRIPKSTFKLFT
jgi:hypothetical protein